MPLQKRRSAEFLPKRLQSNQLISLSWQYGLLLPFCERRISSPATNIGTPRESSRIAIELRTRRLRSDSMLGSSDAPSTPQFQLRLSLMPSRLSSPFASLC